MPRKDLLNIYESGLNADNSNSKLTFNKNSLSRNRDPTFQLVAEEYDSLSIAPRHFLENCNSSIIESNNTYSNNSKLTNNIKRGVPKYNTYENSGNIEGTPDPRLDNDIYGSLKNKKISSIQNLASIYKSPLDGFQIKSHLPKNIPSVDNTLHTSNYKNRNKNAINATQREINSLLNSKPELKTTSPYFKKSIQSKSEINKTLTKGNNLTNLANVRIHQNDNSATHDITGTLPLQNSSVFNKKKISRKRVFCPDISYSF